MNTENQPGWLGKALGGKFTKITNIATLVIFMCFLFLGIVYLYPPTDKIDLSFGQIFSQVFEVIALVMGYLFGYNTNKPTK